MISLINVYFRKNSTFLQCNSNVFNVKGFVASDVKVYSPTFSILLPKYK